MSEKKINPYLKLALELGPIALFFIGYLRLRDQTFAIGGTEYHGFVVMTAIFIPLMVLATLIQWKLTGVLSKMQLVTVVLVVVFGGLSVWLNDERFFKMKPTMIYLFFAGVLGFGLWRGKSYLKAVMGEALPLTDAGWMVLTRRLTAFFAGLAVANELVWRFMSTDAWVNFKTFGLTAAIFLFFLTQGKLIENYGQPKDGPGGES